MHEHANVEDWEQESIQTESEVTLVKFGSELETEEPLGQLQQILQRYTLEQRVNFIINRDRGEIININDGKVIERFGKNCLHDHNNLKDKSLSTKGSPEKKVTQRNSSVPVGQADKKDSEIDHQYVKVPEIPDNVWDDYWELSNKTHQKLLMSICQKNNKLFTELFNKKLNHFPINVNFKSFDNWTPIHYAAMHGNTFALEYLLSTPEIFINSLTNFKMSALHVATKNNKYEACKLLINAGIELNFQDEDGNTALHYACDLGHKDIVTLILGQKERVDQGLKNNTGLTPKDMSCSQDIRKLFTCEESSFFNLRPNRHIEKLLMKVNLKQKDRTKGDEIENERNKDKDKGDKNVKHSGDSAKGGKVVNRPEGKKENIIKMYQLLKERKNSEKVSIESFKFYKKIGEGAFGEVYVVKKGKSDKLYALKAISRSKLTGTNLIKYIKTEKEVLSLISHPFIVGLHFSFQTSAHLFLVMDYCEGGDLGRLLEKHRKFDERTCKYYAAEILLALEALHREKIIYRDLKPDNIVLDKDGHALLTDFGLSRKTTSIDDISRSFCGTPAYLPLEIINKKGHNRMADWYEYGVVLYELYTGIPPFYADTRAELYQNVRAGIIRFPRGTPENFRDIIKKLLSQNPEKRLGFNDDAEEVKNHPWFSDINWEDVYNKKLPMPKVSNKINFGEPIKTKFMETKLEKDKIEGWSFIKG